MNRLTRFTEWLLVLLILALAAYLRVVNVADTPGWYTDEGTHLAIALSSRIVQGPSGGVRYLVVTDSTLLFAKLPGFEFLLAVALRLWSDGMATLRALGRTEALYNLSAYYSIPLFPFIALGVAILLRQGISHLWREVSRAVDAGLAQWPWLAHTAYTARVTTAASWGVGLLLGALVLTPFVTLVAHTIQQVHTHIPTIIDPFLLNPADVRAAADFVNDLVPTHLAPDAVVLASPGLAWQLHPRAADFQMAANAVGHATPHLPRDLPSVRYVFDPRLANAQCVIVDNLWYTWAVWNVPGVDAMLAEVQTWPGVKGARGALLWVKM